jgi:hypothetical protein
MQKYQTWFCYGAGGMLALTAIAKLCSTMGNAHILQYSDPILGLQFGQLMLVAGILELGIAITCLIYKIHKLAVYLIAWLATNLLAYRVCLWFIGWHRPCACLGNFTDALHIPPQIAERTMEIVLAYLLIGSYATLFWLWRQQRKVSLVAPVSEKTPSSPS